LNVNIYFLAKSLIIKDILKGEGITEKVLFYKGL